MCIYYCNSYITAMTAGMYSWHFDMVVYRSEIYLVDNQLSLCRSIVTDHNTYYWYMDTICLSSV